MNWKFWQKKDDKKKQKQKKSKTREWVDALIFAVIAATIIRTFVLEASTIPTPSMEKSLMVGDFLFVSKMHYGARIPGTPLSFPFAHHTMPIIGGKSYLEWNKIPYKRLPGFQSIKNNDIVVFNYPVDEYGRQLLFAGVRGRRFAVHPPQVLPAQCYTLHLSGKLILAKLRARRVSASQHLV